MPPTEARGARGMTDSIAANRLNVNIKRACPPFLFAHRKLQKRHFRNICRPVHSALTCTAFIRNTSVEKLLRTLSLFPLSLFFPSLVGQEIDCHLIFRRLPRLILV